jgi:hypothetical protein
VIDLADAESVTDPTSADISQMSLERERAELDRKRKKAAKTTCVVRVTLEDGVVRQYVDRDIRVALRRDIIGGLIPMGCHAEKRIMVSGICAKRTSGTLGAVATSILSIDCLYRPVWAHALRGMVCGAAIGAFLKLLDTTVTASTINPTLGLLFVLAVASLAVPRAGNYLALVFFLVLISAGITMNIYVAIIVAILVGALLGVLPGMAIGGIVGLVRSRWIQQAPDAVRERVPVVTAVLLPAAGDRNAARRTVWEKRNPTGFTRAASILIERDWGGNVQRMDLRRDQNGLFGEFGAEILMGSGGWDFCGVWRMAE